jgi:uncharacterized protein (TIGR03083 family)
MPEIDTMSVALDGLRADRNALVEIAKGMSRAQWDSPSGCEGWTSKDLVSHMASLFWAVVDASAAPDTSGLGVEEAAAVTVEARRAMTPHEVLADYEAVSLRALEALATVATLDMDIPFSDFESYPASLVPAAFCFDHYTHIRADLFAPRGSLAGQPPPSDELRLRPTLDWIEVAVVKQNAALLAATTGQIELVVTGPGARRIPVGEGEPVATVESDGPSLVLWITQRSQWHEVGARAEGRPAALEAARSLKVY